MEASSFTADFQKRKDGRQNSVREVENWKAAKAARRITMKKATRGYSMYCESNTIHWENNAMIDQNRRALGSE